MGITEILMVAAVAVCGLAPVAQSWLARRASTPGTVLAAHPAAASSLSTLVALLSHLSESGQPIDPKHPLLGLAKALAQQELARLAPPAPAAK